MKKYVFIIAAIVFGIVYFKSIVLFEINISWISLMLNSTSNSNDNLCKIVFISIRYGDDFNYKISRYVESRSVLQAIVFYAIITCIIVKIKVSSKLDKNINIQTKQVLKQNDEKQNLSLLQKVLGRNDEQNLSGIQKKLKKQKSMLQ